MDGNDQNSLPAWAVSCGLCNVELVKEVDEQKELGCSEKKIFAYMSEQTGGQFSPDAIRQRYKYYTKTRGVRNLTPPIKGEKPAKKAKDKINRRRKEIKNKGLSEPLQKVFDDLFAEINEAHYEKWKTASKDAVIQVCESVIVLVKSL